MEAEGRVLLSRFQLLPLAPALAISTVYLIVTMSKINLVYDFHFREIAAWIFFILSQVLIIKEAARGGQGKVRANIIAVMISFLIGAVMSGIAAQIIGLEPVFKKAFILPAFYVRLTGQNPLSDFWFDAALLMPLLAVLALLALARHKNLLDDELFFYPAGLTLTLLTLPRLLFLCASPGFSFGSWPYLPVLNLTDLLQIIGLAIASLYLYQQQEVELQYAKWPTYCLGFGLMAMVTLIIGRTVHHWAGITFTIQALWASSSFQAACAVYWAGCGVMAMIRGHRTLNRPQWFLGAIIMSLDLIKIFVVDLSKVEAISRIVSFVGVGLVLILIGYFAPLPP